MKNKMPIKLDVALPNGSLEKETYRIFREAGIKIPMGGRKALVEIDHPLISSIRFCRPQHIPDLILRETCDVAICGLDCIAEHYAAARKDNIYTIYDPQITILANFDYGRPGRNGKTKVVVFGHLYEDGLDNQLNLRAIEVITEYPKITEYFFKDKYKAKINAIFSYGSTEGMVPRPYKLGVCIVDSGKTLAINGLKILDVIMESSTVFIRKTMKWKLEYKGHDTDIKIAAEKLKQLLTKA